MGNELFEQADKQIQSDIESGKFGNDDKNEIEASQKSSPQEDKINDLVDLGKVEKFLWNGKEMTPKELEQSFMRQSDYTKKTQSLAEERKYSENFLYDALKVFKDKSLMSKFQEIYPLSYQEKLGSVLEEWNNLTQAQKNEVLNKADQQQGSAPQKLPDEVVKRLEQLEGVAKGYQDRVFQEEVKAAEAQIDASLNKYLKQYSHADEESVLAKAQQALNQGIELNEKAWERLVKLDHDKNMAKYQNFYKSQINKQQDLNHKGRDTAAGGGVPGQAPKRLSFDEATRAAINDLSGRS